MNKINIDVALSLIHSLSGAPGYPFHPEGEMRLATVLAECCVSVDHARLVIDEFEADCPTAQQLRNVAFRLKDKFVKPPPPAEHQWRKEYGTADPGFSATLLAQIKSGSDEFEREGKSKRAAIKKHLGVASFRNVSDRQYYDAMVALGYDVSELKPGMLERTQSAMREVTARINRGDI